MIWALQTLRTYEPHRDILASIQNKVGNNAGATTRSEVVPGNGASGLLKLWLV